MFLKRNENMWIITIIIHEVSKTFSSILWYCLNFKMSQEKKMNIFKEWKLNIFKYLRFSRISVIPALSASSSILNFDNSWSSFRKCLSTWNNDKTGYFCRRRYIKTSPDLDSNWASPDLRVCCFDIKAKVLAFSYNWLYSFIIKQKFFSKFK